MLFDTFDRTGNAEFPFPKQVVFRALCASIEDISGMSIEDRDDLGSRLDVKAGMSAFSWGERISVSVTANGSNMAIVSVQSGAKTVFGSATTHGKNRKNVREILACTSSILQKHGEAWREEMTPITTEPAGEPVAFSQKSVADELAKLAALRDQGVLTTEEFDTQKRRLLDSL